MSTSPQIQTTYSLDELRTIICGPAEETIQTFQMSKLDAQGNLNPKTYYLKRKELVDTIKEVLADQPLLDDLIRDALNREKGSDADNRQRFEPYPYTQRIVAHFKADPSMAAAFTSFIVNAVGSYVIQARLNKEELCL